VVSRGLMKMKADPRRGRRVEHHLCSCRRIHPMTMQSTRIPRTSWSARIFQDISAERPCLYRNPDRAAANQ